MRWNKTHVLCGKIIESPYAQMNDRIKNTEIKTKKRFLSVKRNFSFSSWSRFIFHHSSWFLSWVNNWKVVQRIKKEERSQQQQRNNLFIEENLTTKVNAEKQWNFHKDENKRQNKVRKTHRDICLCAKEKEEKNKRLWMLPVIYLQKNCEQKK